MDFETRYKKLNDNQKKAVNYIYGPLLIIAGPGTGKTELLSMRTAQILRQTDTLPQNILCLTFTESGATNMQRRLRQIIGEAAYKVNIHTFHGFGTEIISSNREYFFQSADVQPTDELTQRQILGEIFAAMDWKNPLGTKNGDDFVYLADTLKVISEFKQSGLHPDEIRQILVDNQLIIDGIKDKIREIFATKISKNTIELFSLLAESVVKNTQQNHLPMGVTPYSQVLSLSIVHAAQEAFDQDSTKPITAWKNKWCEKNVNDEFVLKDAAMDKLLAAIDVYEQYTAELMQRRLFDYDDMILSVLEALDKNADLRANLQEQYQFIMVDEFQDTNLAQLRLLFQLTDGEEQPNIMAVGDDDQAIFSFQGANVGNIQTFRTAYSQAETIVLTDNYRSSKQILAAARVVITQGTDRLEYTIKDLSKELTAHAVYPNAKVRFAEYKSPEIERASVVQSIENLVKDGVNPESIAVLARRHNELIELLPYLYDKNILVNYERYDDVLEIEIIQILEKLTRIVVGLHKNDLDLVNSLLPEVIAHPAFGLSSGDIWKISLQAWKNRQLWLEAMLASARCKPLAEWLILQANKLPHGVLEQQIDELIGVDPIEGEFSSPLYNYYFSSTRLAAEPDAYMTALEALRTLRQKLRDHTNADTAPRLEQLLEFIDLNRAAKTRITSVRSNSETKNGAINLMTAHKSKGLEFDHVFVISAVDSAWGEKVRVRSRGIRYPANLQLQPAGNTYDERLRLFFVAMTRAKQDLTITYSISDASGKDAMIASFLSSFAIEADAFSERADISPVKIAEIDWRGRLVAPITENLREILSPTLDNYKLSATHLNHFLDVSRGGPQAFLLDNILRFPSAKLATATYGTAIHVTLAWLHNLFKVDNQLPDESRVLKYFSDTLQRSRLSESEFKQFDERGRSVLRSLLESRAVDFKREQIAELNLAGQNVILGDTRLTGQLDVVEVNKAEKTINVTDYKTGKPSYDWRGKTDYEKIKLHKYRQQLMFYQLLLAHSRDYAYFTFTGGHLQFVEPDDKTGEILSLEATFSAEELTDFSRLIQVVWQKIITLDLPDISGYTPDYKGILQFEADLLS